LVIGSLNDISSCFGSGGRNSSVPKSHADNSLAFSNTLEISNASASLSDS
jgi:hypothetical protein